MDNPPGDLQSNPTISTLLTTNLPISSGHTASTHALLSQTAVPGIMNALPALGSTSQQPSSNTSSGNQNFFNKVVSVGFKSSLKALKKTANAVPPLGAAVDFLVDAAELVPEIVRQQKEYEQFESNVIVAAQGLQEHMRELEPGQLPASVAGTAEALKRYAEDAKEKQQRGRLQQYANINQDADDVMECYRRIQALFQQLQSDVTLSVWRLSNETLRLANENLSVANENLMNTRLSGLSPVHQARYNSNAASQVRRRGCTENTRELVLGELREWASNPSSVKIYWMNGMAGTGKTTIAYSLCAMLKSTNQLAASFFCSRALQDCQEVARIVPTVAYQLARFSHAFQVALCEALGDNPDIATCDIATQFEELLSRPLIKVKNTLPAGLLVITIDALDECADRSEAQTLLDTLLLFVSPLPVKFFITCRPEPYMLEKAVSWGSPLRSIFHLHNIDESRVRSDIERYLTVELEPIQVSIADIKRLAKMSGKLFIYAATAARYIRSDHTPVNRYKRLNVILNTAQLPSSKAYAIIDGLYAVIVSSALDNPELETSEAEVIKLVLHTIICAREPVSVHVLAGLLKLESVEEVQLALQSLQSVLHISAEDELVSTLHASFPDYILNEERSGRFFCNSQEHNKRIAECCFGAMVELPNFNAHNFEFFSKRNLGKDSTNAVLSQVVPVHLFYACQYWGDHLIGAGNTRALDTLLHEFLYTRVLVWMEFMRIQGSLESCPRTILEVQKWSKICGVSEDMSILMDQIQMYILLGTANATPQRSFPSRTHVLLLALWKVNGPAWKMRRKPIRKLGESYELSTKPSLLVAEESRTVIVSIAISLDGRRVVSGSNDGIICIWNAFTGKISTSPFRGHSRTVKSVAFSPDGNHVISGSYDHTIRLWHAATGARVPCSFEGHTSMIGSVTFSPDGSSIASGFIDSTIRVWDAYSGLAKGGPFKGHTAMVNSVAFSPDSGTIASGSDDATVRIWDALNGCPVNGPLHGHKGTINHVMFSPDGSRLASASGDCTIIIWDTRTGQVVSGPLRGHNARVISVGFSPDSSFLVSGSADRTFRMWNSQNGRPTGTTQEHRSPVIFAAFSNGGNRIVSGTAYGQIRIWDVDYDNSTSASSLSIHVDSINLVAFSHDGGRVASVSSNGTICIWNTHTGQSLTDPFRVHTSGTVCLTFSPNDSLIGSASNDCEVLVSNSQNGDTIAGPFRCNYDYTRAYRSIVFSPDGNFLACGFRSRTVHIWDLRPGSTAVQQNPLSTTPVYGRMFRSGSENYRWNGMRAYHDSVTSVSFSPTGSHVASGSEGGEIFVWDIHTGTVVFRRQTTDPVTFVKFSTDGNHLISVCGAEIVEIWQVHKDNASNSPTDKSHGWLVNCSSQIVSTISLQELWREGVVSIDTKEGFNNAMEEPKYETDKGYWEQFYTRL